MSIVLLYAYLGGWIATSIVAVDLARRLPSAGDPAAHPRLLSLLAGAAWPVLVVAVAQAGAMALTAEVFRRSEGLVVDGA